MKVIDMPHPVPTGSQGMVGKNISNHNSANISEAVNQAFVIIGIPEKVSISPYALALTIPTFERRLK